MPVVLICGGTGLIGNRLSTLLTEKGYEVIILTRHFNTDSQPVKKNISYALWNPEANEIDKAALGSADYIINLAGAGVADERWTAKRKQVIIESRVNSGHTIVKAIRETPNKIKAVVNASAIGWYGDDDLRKGEKGFTEDSAAAADFLANTCRAWEESIHPVYELGKRLVKIRIGIVLSKEGGALKEFAKPVRFGIAAILGNGRQVQSWIHIDDVCRICIYAIENENLQGVYNAVSPLPVDNRTLITTLAKKTKGSFYITIYVPSFILKIALGEMSTEVLKSATVNSEKIRQTGFQFIYPSIEAALNALV
ncbi:MAG: TIGR01777 family oxidoreductase [Agriterribacter sp.]